MFNNSNQIDMNYITDNIYLGSQQALYQVEELRRHGITHILTVHDEYVPVDIKDNFYHKHCVIADNPSESLMKVLPEALTFMNSIGKNDKILVHCAQGRSRSVSIVIAWIMQRYNISFPEAYAFVASKRLLYINHGFVQQLNMLRFSK